MTRTQAGVLYRMLQLHMMVYLKHYTSSKLKEKLHNRKSRVRFYANIAHVLDMLFTCCSHKNSSSHSFLFLWLHRYFRQQLRSIAVKIVECTLLLWLVSGNKLLNYSNKKVRNATTSSKGLDLLSVSSTSLMFFWSSKFPGMIQFALFQSSHSDSMRQNLHISNKNSCISSM